jgi:hypothetical protein
MVVNSSLLPSVNSITPNFCAEIPLGPIKSFHFNNPPTSAKGTQCLIFVTAMVFLLPLIETLAPKPE